MCLFHILSVYVLHKGICFSKMALSSCRRDPVEIYFTIELTKISIISMTGIDVVLNPGSWPVVISLAVGGPAQKSGLIKVGDFLRCI